MVNEKNGNRQFRFEMSVHRGQGTLIPALARNGWMSFIGVLSGKVNLRAGIFTRQAVKGEIVFVSSNMLITCESVDCDSSVRLMSFHESIVSQNMDVLDAELFYMLAVQARNSLFVFGNEHPLHPSLFSLMEAAESEYEAKDICYAMPIRANLYLMMTELLRYYGGVKRVDDRLIYHNIMRLKPVLDRIDHDFAEKITIPELASELCLTPDHFTRIFREGVGVPPIEYINRVRLGNALTLLAPTDLPVTDVAHASGFFSMHYFYRIFKENIGDSPISFREHLADKH